MFTLTKERLFVRLLLMAVLSTKKDRIAATRALSALFSNLSAAWFGLAFISPNFLPIKGFKEIFLLTIDVFWGIVFLWISYKLERRLL